MTPNLNRPAINPGPLTEADFRRFDQTGEPGPQQSECPESHWRAVDALVAVGLVVAIALIVTGA